ncbi:MAG: transcription termination factor NusA [Spirochaetaceae bacterium]|jgi:N utilization substance protein A|nr:transcription termination factor NusA [Spirochaetaceae bacterium]
MAIDVSDAIQQLIQDRGMSRELVLQTIEKTLVAAYRRRFGNLENVVVRFKNDQEVSIYAKKKIVDRMYNKYSEIEVEDALELNSEAEIGDEILIEIDPKEFTRGEVQSAKQTARQSLREIQKDTLYAEYKEKIGEIIIGYYQRERNGMIYVDLGKIEGILPKKFQSPREVYHLNDRIKALVAEVKNEKAAGIEVILSRTHTDFVRAIFEVEVPEIYDKTVEIHKIVREPGYRTNMAVNSNQKDVDPVGACVGLKGVRIQTIIKELEGEKIDVLKYEPDPRKFIMNALSPAEVRDVIIMNEAKHQALAVVNESQLSLAIGKQGLNVKLANRLVDWNIDVKTDEQAARMDIRTESRRAVSELFGDEISRISELPGVDKKVVSLLLEHKIDYIEDFISLSQEELGAIDALTPEQLDSLRKLIDEYVEIIEEAEEEEEAEEAGAAPAPAAPAPAGSGADEAEEEEEEYECPECGAKIFLDMNKCLACGIGLSFEYEEEEEE